jgi:hypothetical protein
MKNDIASNNALKNNNNSNNTNSVNSREDFVLVALPNNKTADNKNAYNSRESSPFELVDDPNSKGDNLVSSVPFFSPQLGNATRLDSPRSNDGKDGGCGIS